MFWCSITTKEILGGTMDGYVRAENLIESDLDYILSMNDIEPNMMSLLRLKISFVQKILDSENGLVKNPKFNMKSEARIIKNKLGELDDSIMAFCGLQTHNIYKIILSRLIIISKVIKHLKLPDEPEESKVAYSDLKDEYLAACFNLKVKLNKQLNAQYVGACEKSTLSQSHGNSEVPNQAFVSRFDEDFVFIQYLGAGGFGAVVEARHKHDGRHYAVKRIEPLSERSRNKVTWEVNALAKLDHSNIVRYYTCWPEYPVLDQKEKPGRSCFKALSNTTTFEDTSGSSTTRSKSHLEIHSEHLSEDKENHQSPKHISKKYVPLMHFYIQMELCKPENLDVWLDANEERDYNYIKNIFVQILDAVEYIHSQKLIHRDLKPGNIFFSLDGRIKVGDFGLVLDVGSSGKVYYTRDGTKMYMSPELGSGTYDYKVDIYALGIVLFELLVYFSTGMERYKTLTELKAHKYPDWFAEIYPLEYSLIQNMLCEDPRYRLTAGELRGKILSVSDGNNNFNCEDKMDQKHDSYEENFTLAICNEHIFEDEEKLK